MSRLAFCLLALLAGSAAAAPNVTHLYPPGGQRGTTVTVTAAGTFPVWPVKVWASGKGVAATAGKAKGELKVAIAADAEPGVYWLRAHDDSGGGNLRPFVVGTLAEVNEKEPNDSPRTAQKLAGPTVVNGRLQARGDVDCFAVEAKKGQTVVASLLANRTLRSPMDGVLQVVSPEGIVLEQNNDFHGLDPQVACAVPKDGTYVVRVFAFPQVPDSTIGFAGGEGFVYRLTVTTGGYADHALPLAVSRAKPGKVRLVGWNIPEAARSVDVPKSDAGIVSLTAPGVGNAVGVRLEAHETYDDTAGGVKGPLTVPFTLTGLLGKREGVASYGFAGKRGQQLVIQVEAQALGFPLAPVVRVVDAEGKQLARAEPAKLHRDVELKFTPPRDGAYRVEVRDLYDEGGLRHFFRLRVVRPEPRVQTSVTTDRFTITPGKPLEVRVVLDRRGVTGEVEVVAEGLPAGVTPKVAKKDARSVTLALTTDKGAVSGPFRVVARTKSGSWVATAALKELDEPTPHLWLTVAGAGAKK
jgi:hypothetical protein